MCWKNVDTKGEYNLRCTLDFVNVKGKALKLLYLSNTIDRRFKTFPHHGVI